MKLVLKNVGYIFAGLAGLVVLAFIVLQLISNAQYKEWIVGAVQSATGRELAIDGPFELNIGSRLGLTAGDVRFANAPWASREDMATIERLFVELRLLPLIKGVLDVTVELDAPDIQLETSEAGQGNWAFASKEAEPPEEALRRRARAPRAHAGDRPLGWLQVPVADRDRQGGRWRGLPRASAGGEQSGTPEARRLLARLEEVARRSPAPAERSGPVEPQVRAT